MNWIRRLRPALWSMAIVLLALYASVNWEAARYYDDGGLGAAAFLVTYTLGLPFVLGVWLSSLLFPEPSTSLGIVILVAAYLGLDRWVSGPWYAGERSPGPSS